MLKVSKVVLTLQLVVCFLLMLLNVKVAFQTGLMATRAQRLAEALRGIQNEFATHDSQVQAASEIAQWAGGVRNMHPYLLLLFLGLALGAIICLAGLRTAMKTARLCAG